LYTLYKFIFLCYYTEIPEKISTKFTSLKNKNLGNRFVSNVSKTVLKMGYDIEFIGKSGNAITFQGKDAMERNGRKWTIGYKTVITIGNTKIDFIFDAITDESVDNRPTYYVVDKLRSVDKAITVYGEVMGSREFISWLKESLSEFE